MNLSAATASPQQPDRPEPPFDPGVVVDVLRQFDKTTRAHQLYMRNNPTYMKSLEALRTSFAALWELTEALPLQVTDTQFAWFGAPVLEEPEKASDSLPWTMYKDGVREITFTAGFEGEELENFLDIIPRVRKAAAHEDDLLTLLWEQEFVHLTYRYVDVSSEPGLPLDTGAEPGRWPVSEGEVVADPRAAIEEARESQGDGKPGGDASVAEAAPSGIVKMEDFDSTLYFLEPDEIAYLRAEAEREYEMDVRRTVLNALLDVFELQADPLIRTEVAHDLDALTLHLLAGRQFSNVAYLLREISVVLERARDLSPGVRALLGGLPDRLSHPETLSQLLEAMDEAQSLPPQEELNELFVQLRPGALGTLFAWVGQAQNAKLRPLLERAAERLAASNTAELVRLVGSAESHVAIEAVKRSGGLRTAAAVPALGKALGEPLRELRLAAVAALVEIGTAGALQALERALDDADRDVRVATIKALASKAYKPALGRVGALVKAKEIRDADRTERVALFELYGLLCGDGGIPFLDELLNGKGGLFARKEEPDIRACAAAALGKMNSPRAQQALSKAAGEKDVVVRSAVGRALKGGAA